MSTPKLACSKCTDMLLVPHVDAVRSAVSTADDAKVIVRACHGIEHKVYDSLHKNAPQLIGT